MAIESGVTALAQAIGADVKALQGAALRSATLSIGGVAKGYAEAVLVLPGVSPSAKVMAQFAPQLDDAENDLEELIDSAMRLWCVAEAGQIRFVLSGNAAFTGPYTITYQVAV